jgi:hypothetical protein
VGEGCSLVLELGVIDLKRRVWRYVNLSLIELD